MKKLIKSAQAANFVHFIKDLQKSRYSEEFIKEIPILFNILFAGAHQDYLLALIFWLSDNSYCHLKEDNKTHYYFQEIWDNKLAYVLIEYYCRLHEYDFDQNCKETFVALLKSVCARACEYSNAENLLRFASFNKDFGLVKFYFEQIVPNETISFWESHVYWESLQNDIENSLIFECIAYAGLQNDFKIANYLLSFEINYTYLDNALKELLEIASQEGNFKFFEWTYNKLNQALNLRQKYKYMKLFLKHGNYLQTESTIALAKLLNINTYYNEHIDVINLGTKLLAPEYMPAEEKQFGPTCFLESLATSGYQRYFQYLVEVTKYNVPESIYAKLILYLRIETIDYLIKKHDKKDEFGQFATEMVFEYLDIILSQNRTFLSFYDRIKKTIIYILDHELPKRLIFKVGVPSMTLLNAVYLKRDTEFAKYLFKHFDEALLIFPRQSLAAKWLQSILQQSIKQNSTVFFALTENSLDESNKENQMRTLASDGSSHCARR